MLIPIKRRVPSGFLLFFPCYHENNALDKTRLPANAAHLQLLLANLCKFQLPDSLAHRGSGPTEAKHATSQTFKQPTSRLQRLVASPPPQPESHGGLHAKGREGGREVCGGSAGALNQSGSSGKWGSLIPLGLEHGEKTWIFAAIILIPAELRLLHRFRFVASSVCFFFATQTASICEKRRRAFTAHVRTLKCQTCCGDLL